MSRALFFPPTINGETEWISPKEDIMFQSLSELLGAYQKRDPAARSKLEIFLLYPGVHAVIYPPRRPLALLSQPALPGPAGLPVEPLLDRHRDPPRGQDRPPPGH